MTRPEEVARGLTELRRSINEEARADLLAAACNFREASALMKEVNAIRRRAFGPISDPNFLREKTLEAVRRVLEEER